MKIIRQHEITSEIGPGGGMRVDMWNSEIEAWERRIDKDVNHRTTVTISIVEWVQ